MIKFSNEFIEKLVITYPVCTDYHDMAKNGDIQLINALSSMSDEEISVNEIIECLEKGEEGRHNLYDRAKRLQEKQDIYSMALDEFHKSEDNGQE